MEALSLTCTTRVVSSQNNSLCNLTFGMANTPLVTCHSVLFEVKTTYFYLIMISFIIFILFFLLVLLDFHYFGFLSGLRVVSDRFRVVPVRFRVAPGGSGRFW